MENITETNKSIRVLCLEDVRMDAELLHEILVDDGFLVKMDVASGEKEYTTYLNETKYDIILADYSLPGFNAPSALKLAQSLQPEVPFICVSGSIGEEQAVELLKLGATDYVLKDRLGRLGFSIHRALEGAEKQKAKILAEHALRVSEENLRKLNADLETRVKARTIELENTNKALESFSYSVSHDLRAPLRAISSFSSILQNNYQTILDVEGNRFLQLVLDNAKRMDRLIKDLLELSKTTGHLIVKQSINLNQMIRSIYQEFVSEEERGKISFEVDDLNDCFGDPNLMQQVWVNLITNAVKYSKKEEHPVIAIQSYVENNQTIYLIKDNGVGFNPEYTNKLFAAFQRLHSSNEFEGTGIGLAIVERIITRHGGSVWAEGKVGHGATFYFSLPNTMTSR